MGAIRSRKARAAEGFGLRFEDELRDGEAVPDQTLALELAGRAVQTAIDELVAADNRYCGEGTRRQMLNRACQAVARNEVYPEVRDLRSDIDTMFGRENARSVHHMEGKTRRKPKPLHEQLELVVDTLRAKRLLATPLRAGAVIDREGWLARVEPGYKKLTAMLKELDNREATEARLRQERDYELESFDVVYSEMLAFVRSVYCLAGLGERVIWHLLPTVQRQRLSAKARQEGEARADGKRAGEATRPANPATSSVA